MLQEQQSNYYHRVDESKGGSRVNTIKERAEETPMNSILDAHAVRESVSFGHQEDRNQNSQINPPVLCSLEMNAWCPPKNKCCPQFQSEDGARSNISGSENIIVGYTCLGSSKGSYPVGSCCNSNSRSNIMEMKTSSERILATGTGCAIGYKCASPEKSSAAIAKTSSSFHGKLPLDQRPHCKNDEGANPLDNKGQPIDIQYDLLPRYRTCPAFNKEDIAVPFGLGIPISAAKYHHFHQNDYDQLKIKSGYIGKLAYFSNMGPIDNHDIHNPELIIQSDGDGAMQIKQRSQQLQFKRESQRERQSKTKTAIVVIHGSGRDAASYLCSMIGALEAVSSSTSPYSGMTLEDFVQGVTQNMQFENDGNQKPRDKKHSLDSFVQNLRKNRGPHSKTSSKSKVMKDEIGDALVISPWFLAPQDGNPNNSPNPSSRDSTLSAEHQSLPFLQWDDDHPIAHTFRYGAESLPNEHSEYTVSSFAAMDVLLETLCDRKRFPNLDKVIVTGHSAGGQFVQRWGVSSDSWCFGDGSHLSGGTFPTIKLVPANPRSYAYLDGRRYLPLEDDIPSEGDKKDPSMFHQMSENNNEEDDVTLKFRFPNPSEKKSCSEYNSYEWGLEQNPLIPAPYIISNTRKLINDSHDKDVKAVFQRYASRDVVYLSGERDTEVLGPQICEDDGYQGPTRRERSERFYASLQALWEEVNVNGDERQVHDRILVENVGHDHALMFQSEEGLRGLFR